MRNSLNIEGVSVEDIKARWRTLRDTYVKKKKEIAARKKSGSGTSSHIRWHFMDMMGFLEQFIREASTESNMGPPLPAVESVVNENACKSSSATVTVESQNRFERNARSDADDEIQSSSSSEQRPHQGASSIPNVGSTYSAPNEIRKPKKKRYEQLSNFESSFLELAKAQSARLEAQSSKQRDAMDAFFDSCSLRAKQLSKAKQAWLQMQVSMLLYTAETDDTNVQQFIPHVTQNSQVTPMALSSHQSSQVAMSAIPCTNTFNAIPDVKVLDNTDSCPQSGLDVLSMAMSTIH